MGILRAAGAMLRFTYLGIQLFPHAPTTARSLLNSNDHISDQAKHEHSNALITRRDDLRHGAHTYDSRASRSEQPRLSARLVRGPADPRVRALSQRRALQTEIVRGAERSEP